MRWRSIIVVIAASTAGGVARSGHELPVYPSYYPHEIEIAAATPARAAVLLHEGKMHAYVGAAPGFPGAAPGSVAASRQTASVGCCIRSVSRRSCRRPPRMACARPTGASRAQISAPAAA